MQCARLDHFVRLNSDGTIGKCGHMVDAPGFLSFDAMQSSGWLELVKSEMANDQWPTECRRCQHTETNHGHSIRLHSLNRHAMLHQIRSDYLILGGTLDNICNSACQSCDASLSTKIGSLTSRNYKIVDNSSLLSSIPSDRLLEIDLNGGEPTASRQYQQLIKDLPPNVMILRVNTNGSRVLPGLQRVLESKVKVILTLSLDGTDLVHDYVRWPIKWATFCDTVSDYRDLAEKFDNLELQAWTTLHALNLSDFANIKRFAQDQHLQHDWAYLEQPHELNVRYRNSFTVPYKYLAPEAVAIDQDNQIHIDKFIARQDRMRSIDIKDYL